VSPRFRLNEPVEEPVFRREAPKIGSWAAADGVVWCGVVENGMRPPRGEKDGDLRRARIMEGFLEVPSLPFADLGKGWNDRRGKRS
jgi:hypothetical protein